MFRVEPTIYGHIGDAWQWSLLRGEHKAVISSQVFPTKEAAAEDLWRRMEGVS